jgi:hypothetical protein
MVSNRVDVRTVSKTLDTVPERTTDCAHAESTTEIVQGPVVGTELAGWCEAEEREVDIHPRARVSAVIHGECEMCVVVVEVVRWIASGMDGGLASACNFS